MGDHVKDCRYLILNGNSLHRQKERFMNAWQRFISKQTFRGLTPSVENGGQPQWGASPFNKKELE
jgi:hypothetical protein